MLTLGPAKLPSEWAPLMRLAPPPLDITDDEGFQRDIFGAKEAGERLANVVADLEGHSVIVLDGGWGTGKTTFIKQWAGLLRTKGGHPVVYLDAFGSDHLSDPFFAMLAQVLDYFDQRELKDLSATLAAAAKGVLRAIPAVAARRLLPVATGGVVSLADFEGLKTSLKDASSDPTEDWFSEQLQAARSEAASTRRFKKVLGDVVEKAAMGSSSPPRASAGSGEEVPSSEGRKAPLIFIIDELDRCKPSFALSVLERMKHVFSANGVCFVLVTNLKELTAMVRDAYGLEHPERYLEKFYHLRVEIESLLSLSRIERRGRYLEHDRTARHLIASHGQSEPGIRIRNERGQTPMAILRNHGGSGLVVGLCVIRIRDATLYRKAASGRLTFAEARDFFDFDGWEDRPAAEVEENIWGRVTVEGTYEEQEPRWSLTMEPKQVLPSICRHIDLFWHERTA